ncbi:hypothetical protein G9A89_012103 [Geosiphon pyriformis]|nr:hypothetical protein G9A89_012103 [Geosiphon pyriformis]
MRFNQTNFPIIPPSTTTTTTSINFYDSCSTYKDKPSTRRSQSTSTNHYNTDLYNKPYNSRNTIPRVKKDILKKSSDQLFWDIVGRDNYTTSLNNSPVLCYTFSPPAQDFFNTAFSQKLANISWRPKKFSQSTLPTMVPKAVPNPISLLTTTIKSRSSLKESPTVASTLFGDWESQNSSPSNLTLTPPQEVPELIAPEEKMSPVKLFNRKPDTDPVLDTNIAEQIRQQLPRRLRLEPAWTLLYSIDQDGTSMTTMYYNIKDKGPLILAIKDEENQVFGAFVTEPFKPRPSYYGNGECFLWKCTKHNDQDPTSSKLPVRFYLWTGRNEYLIFSEHDYVAIGGGDGRVGLWIDSDLERGHSDHCDTFDNETLSSSPNFECLGLEIWGFKN